MTSARSTREATASERASFTEGRFLPGTLLAGRYRLVALVGRGGMGEVYRADDTRLGQTVALKFLPDSVASDAAALERFYTEVRIGRQVSHPNVCRLYDLVEIDGHHCLSMEFIDGEDLASLLKRIGRLPTDKAISIAREVCAGLGAAHDKGVIHRDLKPANIMIDSDGRARITDFGLAALAEDANGQAFAGTPAYMAPEQFDGSSVSVRSDIFALGAVLYETFTGKRVFEGRSLADIKAAHEHFKPPSLSSSVHDIPPTVEQVVLQCLQKQPGARPPSAYAVIAALPGGDPLQAALAAGETPSPAMVAAAGKVGDLSVAAAWTALAAALAGMMLIAWLAAGTTTIGRLRPDKSPDVLREQARALSDRLGYADPAAHSASFFTFDFDYLKFIGAKPSTRRSAEYIDRAQPGPLLFVHRISPRVLAANSLPNVIIMPAEVGRLGPDDPPLDVAGMTRVTLDQRGMLTEFVAVPPRHSAPLPAAAAKATVDWSPLLAAAGVDAKSLAPTPSTWSAPVDSDSKQAWSATYSGQPNVPMHIEAAAFRGKPVWFALRGPWVQPRRAATSSFVVQVAWVALVFSTLTLIGIGVMLRRNLRMGRGDRRGALVLARVILVSLIMALLIRADHVASVLVEMRLVANIFAQALYFAVAAWALYLSFEPYARRRWPDLMISWSRLLAGRLRDPMVGRDLLIGALGGIAMALMVHLDIALPSGFGHVQHAPLAQVATPMTSVRHLGFFFLINIYTAVGLGLASLVGIVVMQAITRSRWLAVALQFGITYLYFLSAVATNPPFSGALALSALIWFLLLMRFGLLAAGAGVYFFMLLNAIPLTLDTGAWHFGRTLIGLGVLAVVLLYAFHASLGGKALIPHSLIEGDASPPG